jgi:uncharacterized protein YndB with AHSA1/START domain
MGGQHVKDRNVTHNTFVIERSYPTTPERVFAALADPDKKRRWFAAESSTQEVESFEMDFRVGGTERARYRFKSGSLFPGVPLINDASYQDIVPNQRVVVASTMTVGDKRISASLSTFELLPAKEGTNLIFTHQGAFFEGSDGPERREGGWQHLLELLGTELAS